MKKLLLSAFGFAAMMAGANAQIFSENFDAGIPGTFTLTDVDGATPNANVSGLTDAWNAGTGTDDAGLAKDGILSTSWIDPAGQVDDWISTPAITIPATANTVVLEWNSMTLDANYLDGLQVYTSTTGATPADFLAGTQVYISAAEPTTWTANQVVLGANQTIYIGFRNNSTDKFVLAVDDIVVRELLPIDAVMTSLDVAEYVAAGNTTISGVITNNGSSTITTMDVVWDDGSGPQTDNLTGLSIAPGATYNFNHATPLTVVAGTTYPLTVSVSVAGDGDATNNSLMTSVIGVTSIPAKVVVSEENTGTWCQYCPAGAVGLANMEAEADFIGIAVHNGDPMAVASYDGASATLFPDFTGYPNGAVDRVYGTYPSAAGFLTEHNKRKTEIVPCAVNSVTATLNSSTNMVSVSAVAEFVGNVTGDYRLSCIITQDDMVSADAGWDQVNAYAGGGSGLAMPAGQNNDYNFDTGTNPAPAAAFGGYDHTARSLSNDDIYGDAGSLPASPTIGTYNHTFTDVDVTAMPGVGSVPFDATKAHAVVMVIAPNGTILNAGSASISVVTSTEEVVEANNFQFSVFPNPAVDNATVTFSLETANNVKMEVYNAMGALVASENAGQLVAGNHTMDFDGTDLNAGFYFVNLTIGNDVITKKVTLTK